MPELPEVETVARTLAPNVIGRRIAAAHLFWDKSLQGAVECLKPGPHSILGRRIAAVSRRGKALLLHLEAPNGVADENSPHLLAFHLKMSGQVMVHPAEEAAHKHTRLIFDLLEADAAPSKNAPLAGRLFFDDTRKFGYCRILTPATLRDWTFWQNLGPEPLEIDAATFQRRFFNAQERPRAGKIKALLLDQSVIAGIGNIYADEALFRAGIAPATRPVALSPQNFTRLHEAVREVLLEAIAACGSSIRDYRDANGNVGAFQNTFRVYGRKGEACVACAAPLAAGRIAGRTTVFCPNCQK